MDFTLNNMTLLALTLAVGIVIDDAIVVLENIVRYIEEKRLPAASRPPSSATKEITLAVLATTLSLVIIFLPIAFMSGLRAALREPVRLDDGVLDPGLDAGELHPHPDAQLALAPQARRQAAGHASKDWPFFAWIDRKYGELLALVARPPRAVMAVALGDLPARLPAEHAGGPRLDPPRRPGRADRAPQPARGHLARRDRRASPRELAEQDRASCKEVEFVNPYVHEGHHEPLPHLRPARGPRRAAASRNLDAAAEVRKHLRPDPEPPLQGHDPVRARGRRELLPHPRHRPGPGASTRTAELAKEAGRPHPPDRRACSTWSPRVSLNSPELQVQDRPPARRATSACARPTSAGAVRLMIAGEDQISTYKEGDEQYDVTLQLLPEQQKDPERAGAADDPVVQGGPGAPRQRGHHRARAWDPRASSATTASSRCTVNAQQRPRLPAGRGRPRGERGDPRGRAAPRLQLQVRRAR